MDIVVHGTKGGRKTFTPKKIGGLLDISADASEPSAMGKEAYAVRFVENNVIFSKYKIVRDVRGDKRTGFLGFSLFLQNNEKLSGSDIITLLNRVSKEYCQTYIPENDNNLKDIREDWTFLTRIEEEYRPKIKSLSSDDIETLQSGAKDDAFIFFKDDTELQKYFDVPYQEEYSPYRQILFVKEDLKKKPENPLNALRHSENNLTGRIDLENPKYKLIYNQTAKGGVKIEVKVNGAFRHSKSKIRRKDELEISWSKPYYETVIKRGRWSDIENGFLDANDSLQTVSIKEIELSPRTKTITFQIKNRNGFPESDAEITCKSHYQPTPKPISNNQAEFTAGELGEKWTVSAKKGDNLKSKEQSFTPENISNYIEITLNEYKTVKFSGTIDGKIENNIRITIPRKNINNNAPEAVFENDEINQTFEVTAICPKGNISYEGSKNFTPKNGDVTIELKKVEVKKYRIDAGENGRKSDLCPGYSNKEDGSDIKSHIKPNKGWKFTGFKLNESKTGDYDGTLVAQYEKKPFFANPKVIITSAIAVLALIFGIWSLFFKSDTPEIATSETLESQIIAYVEATELFDNKLKNYKSQWENQKPEIKIEKKSWLSIIGIGNKEEKIDSTGYKQWEEVSESIERAIAKRGFINSYNIDLLKTLRYSNEQQKFKEAIIKIDSTKYEELKNEFKEEDISSWDLNKIAESINDFLNPSAESEETVQTDEKNITVVQAGQTTNTASNNTDEIAQKLKSNTITKQQLEEWKNDTGKSKYKKNIDLYLEFWNSVNNDQKSVFDDLLKKVNNDNVLKNSELKRFLDGICANPEAFQKYNSAPGKATCKTINELRETMK